MKKVLAFILAMTLAMSMALSAAAVGSPTAPTKDPNATSPVPEVSRDGLEDDIVIELIPVEDAENLPEEQQKEFADAQGSLEDATPDGMTPQYFFFFRAFRKGEGDQLTKIEDPIDVKFLINGIDEVVVKQYIDGEWVELPATINEDGTVTVEGLVEAPTAIFTKASLSAEAEGDDADKIIIELVPMEEADRLTEEQRGIFEESEKTLADNTPAEMDTCFRFFRAFYVNGDVYTPVTEPLTFKLNMAGIEELAIKQYLNQEWVDTSAVINSNGTITVEDAVEGPIAIFTK